MQKLAILTPANEETKARKIWGQVRHVVSFIAGGLITFGVLKITNGQMTEALDAIGDIVTDVEVLIGAIMAVIANISSWFDKK